MLVSYYYSMQSDTISPVYIKYVQVPLPRYVRGITIIGIHILDLCS